MTRHGPSPELRDDAGASGEPAGPSRTPDTGEEAAGRARRGLAAAAAFALAALTTLVAAVPGLPSAPAAAGEAPATTARQDGQAWAAAAGRALSDAMARDRSEQDPEEARERLARLEEQIDELQRRLDELGERRVGVVEEFETADVRLALSRRRLEIVRLRLDVVSRDLEERRAEVLRLERGLVDAREDLARRVVALYRMGPLSYSRVLLAADTADEILTGYQMVTRLAAQDRSMISRVRIRLADYREAVAGLEESQRELDAVRREESEAVADLRERQDERQELIRQIDIQADESRRALAARQEDAERMSLLVADLGGGTSGGADAAPDAAAAGSGEPPAEPAATFEAAAGQLPWPGEGEVTLSFGRQRHPVYDTYTLSKGIEIAAAAGSPVRAVFPGRVVFADWFQSYGLVVILNHGGDWFTIYGHLNRVEVRRGDRVAAGEPVATVGDSGSLTGPSLYFEIRQGTEALNPRDWLRPR